MLFVKQQPFTQILDGTARSLTSGFPQCSKTFAPQVSAGATKITPATQPTPACHKWASDDKLCYRFNRGECISRSCRFGHKCLIYQSAAHPAKTCPILQPARYRYSSPAQIREGGKKDSTCNSLEQHNTCYSFSSQFCLQGSHPRKWSTTFRFNEPTIIASHSCREVVCFPCLFCLGNSLHVVVLVSYSLVCVVFFFLFFLCFIEITIVVNLHIWCMVPGPLIPILTQVPTGAVPPIAAYTMFAPLLARQLSQIQRLGGEHQGAEDEIFSEIRTVLSKAMGNDSNFPFMMLQPMGSGCKTLPVPALSASFLWTARKISGSAKNVIYIMAAATLQMPEPEEGQ